MYNQNTNQYAGNSGGAEGGTKENQMFGLSGDSGLLKMND